MRGQTGQAWADEAPAPSPRVSHCPLVPCACVASRAHLLFIKADLSPSRSCGSVLRPPPSLVHDGLSVCPAVLAHMHSAAHLFLTSHSSTRSMGNQPSCQGQGRPQRTPEEAGAKAGAPDLLPTHTRHPRPSVSGHRHLVASLPGVMLALLQPNDPRGVDLTVPSAKDGTRSQPEGPILLEPTSRESWGHSSPRHWLGLSLLFSLSCCCFGSNRESKALCFPERRVRHRDTQRQAEPRHVRHPAVEPPRLGH